MIQAKLCESSCNSCHSIVIFGIIGYEQSNVLICCYSLAISVIIFFQAVPSMFKSKHKDKSKILGVSYLRVSYLSLFKTIYEWVFYGYFTFLVSMINYVSSVSVHKFSVHFLWFLLEWVVSPTILSNVIILELTSKLTVRVDCSTSIIPCLSSICAFSSPSKHSVSQKHSIPLFSPWFLRHCVTSQPPRPL